MIEWIQVYYSSIVIEIIMNNISNDSPYHCFNKSRLFSLEHLTALSKCPSLDIGERKKNSFLQTLEKKKEERVRREKALRQSNNHQNIDRFGVFISERDSRERLDRILLKNALSNFKQSASPLQINNISIQQHEEFPSKAQKINSTDSTQIQQYKQTRHKQSKQSQKVLAKPHNPISSSLSSNRMNFNRYFWNMKKEDARVGGGCEPNEWYSEMNTIRLEKKMSEKNKKYCRIMIKRINTDQLLTKRKQSHVKRPINRQTLFKIKYPHNPNPNHNPTTTPLHSHTEPIQLNPWSTTEILKEVSQLIHPPAENRQ